MAAEERLEVVDEPRAVAVAAHAGPLVDSEEEHVEYLRTVRIMCALRVHRVCYTCVNAHVHVRK